MPSRDLQAKSLVLRHPLGAVQDGLQPLLFRRVVELAFISWARP